MASIGSAFAQASQQARKANEQRYTQGMGLWDEIIQRYQPGGGFGAGAMASYERGKTRAVGAGMQQLVSSGLANTTVAATIGKKYEEEVGTPFKLQLQDVQSQRLSEAQSGKAGFIERRTDVGPDAGLAAQMGQQMGYAQGIQAGGYGQTSGRNRGFGSSSPGAGAARRREAAKDRASAEKIAGMQYGGGGGGGRAGAGGFQSSYNPAGLNMEQLYGPGTGEEPLQPTGAGGEAKAAVVGSPEWIAERKKMYGEGYTYGAYDMAGYAQYKQQARQQAGTKVSDLMGLDQWHRWKKTTGASNVGTTSYASKGGGFGGRGF